MHWYIARIVFSIQTDVETSKDQFDEHLHLIAAQSQEEAVLKARVLGLQEEDGFVNGKQRVRWAFVNVLDVQPIQDIIDGVQLYSTIFEKDKSEDYIHYVHLRASDLQTTQLI